jgi:hypothetical protein
MNEIVKMTQNIREIVLKTGVNDNSIILYFRNEVQLEACLFPVTDGFAIDNTD